MLSKRKKTDDSTDRSSKVSKIQGTDSSELDSHEILDKPVVLVNFDSIVSEIWLKKTQKAIVDCQNKQLHVANDAEKSSALVDYLEHTIIQKQKDKDKLKKFLAVMRQKVNLLKTKNEQRIKDSRLLELERKIQDIPNLQRTLEDSIMEGQFAQRFSENNRTFKMQNLKEALDAMESRRDLCNEIETRIEKVNSSISELLTIQKKFEEFVNTTNESIENNTFGDEFMENVTSMIKTIRDALWEKYRIIESTRKERISLDAELAKSNIAENVCSEIQKEIDKLKANIEKQENETIRLNQQISEKTQNYIKEVNMKKNILKEHEEKKSSLEHKKIERSVNQYEWNMLYKDTRGDHQLCKNELIELQRKIERKTKDIAELKLKLQNLNKTEIKKSYSTRSSSSSQEITSSFDLLRGFGYESQSQRTFSHR